MILTDDAQTVAKWYRDKTGSQIVPAHTALGLLGYNPQGDIVLAGAIILQMDNDYTATVHMYSELDSHAQHARGVFEWMFSHAYRINAETGVSHKMMKRHLPRLGFKFEGRKKDWFGPGRDVLSFYMTRDSCKWIKRNEHARPTEAA